MSTNDIIQMARKAGAIPIHKDYKQNALVGNENIERFAKLVAEAKREACAKVCDELVITDGLHQAKYCANAIRGMDEE